MTIGLEDDPQWLSCSKQCGQGQIALSILRWVIDFFAVKELSPTQRTSLCLYSTEKNINFNSALELVSLLIAGSNLEFPSYCNQYQHGRGQIALIILEWVILFYNIAPLTPEQRESLRAALVAREIDANAALELIDESIFTIKTVKTIEKELKEINN